MAILTLRLSDDPILRKNSKLVKDINQKIITLLDDMKETLVLNNGVGLAAPQVGILRQVAIVCIDEETYELINPEILVTDGEQINGEGCLSFPGKYSNVKRPAYIKVKYLDRQGNENIVEGTELLAIALSHEIDHLHGNLFIDRIVEIEQNNEESKE